MWPLKETRLIKSTPTFRIIGPVLVRRLCGLIGPISQLEFKSLCIFE